MPNPRREMCERTARVRLRANKGLKEQTRYQCNTILGQTTSRLEMSLKRGKPWEAMVGSKVELFTELKEKVSKKDSVGKEEEDGARNNERERNDGNDYLHRWISGGQC